MSTPIIHKTFVIERTYPTTAARIFRAFSDPKKKQRWFVEAEGFTVESYTFDFRVGGFERSRFRYGDGPRTTFDGVYLDILDNERLVYAYAMTVDGKPLSSSLSSMELVQVGGGTLLRLTEHTAFVDGNDGSADRRAGTAGLLEALAKELAAHD
jgi:uncharacterized protein YndB with AHSA1/START domain